MVPWIQRILSETWFVFLEAAPYIVIGFFVAALIQALFPKERIEAALGRPGLASIIKAALFGIPLPLCSCGVLPTALSLQERGASRGATVSFLVSTPETGIDSIAITYALINPAMTVLRPLAAFVSAVAAGLGVDRFGGPVKTSDSVAAAQCTVCGNSSPDHNHGWIERLRASIDYIVNDFFPDIANWLIIGLVISGIVAAVVPQDFLTRVPASMQMLLSVVAGVPLYICASASTPIAAVLMAKGVSPGAALVFLLVGPATNIASLLVLGRRLGTRTSAIYLATLVIFALLIGWITNTFMGGWNWMPRIADPSLHEQQNWFHYGGALILFWGLLRVWRAQISKRYHPTSSAGDSPGAVAGSHDCCSADKSVRTTN